MRLYSVIVREQAVDVADLIGVEIVSDVQQSIVEYHPDDFQHKFEIVVLFYYPVL